MITTFGALLLKVCFTGSVALAGIQLLKGKPGMFLLGLVVPFVWVFGAVRLANPDSAWARAFYDDGRLRLAHERHPGSHGPAAPVATARPAAPRELTWAYAALIVFAVLCLLPPPMRSMIWLLLSLPVAGLVVVFGALARRGVGWARPTCVVLIAPATAFQLLLLASTWPGAGVRLVPGTLLVAAAVVAVMLLYRPPARAYIAGVSG